MKTVFFDRDGTLNQDFGYVTRPEDLVLIPGASSAIAELRAKGFRCVIVTNQSAINRGYASFEDVEQTNAALKELLLNEHAEAKIDAIYYCPHTPEEHCACRKPNTGMIDGREMIDVKGSFLVGDKFSDLEFGERLGLSRDNCILVRTGHGKDEESVVRQNWGAELNCVDDVLHAARYIVIG